MPDPRTCRSKGSPFCWRRGDALLDDVAESTGAAAIVAAVSTFRSAAEVAGTTSWHFESWCGGREWWAGRRPSPRLSPMRGLPDGGLHVRGDRHARGAVQPM